MEGGGFGGGDVDSVLVGLGDFLPCAVGGVLDGHPCTLVGDLSGVLVGLCDDRLASLVVI